MQILKDDIYRSILDSACDEFYSNDYRNASMRIIAHKAGITVGNLYRYFKNKESILDTLLEPVNTKVREKIIQFNPDAALALLSDEAEDYIASLQTVISQILEYRRESIILLEKSFGTRYSKTKGNLIENLQQQILAMFSTAGKDNSSDTAQQTAGAIAAAFLEGVIAILKASDTEILKSSLDNYLHQQIYGLIHLLQSE